MSFFRNIDRVYDEHLVKGQTAETLLLVFLAVKQIVMMLRTLPSPSLYALSDPSFQTALSSQKLVRSIMNSLDKLVFRQHRYQELSVLCAQRTPDQRLWWKVAQWDNVSYCIHGLCGTSRGSHFESLALFQNRLRMQIDDFEELKRPEAHVPSSNTIATSIRYPAN